MPAHDILDNRNEKLVDHINRILASTESARFAAGYFFLSGLESIAERLTGVKELRLLIGNLLRRAHENIHWGNRYAIRWHLPRNHFDLSLAFLNLF